MKVQESSNQNSTANVVSGAKLRKRASVQNELSLPKTDSDQSIDSGARLAISPKLMKKGAATSNEEKRMAERQASGPAGRGSSSGRRIMPQFVASGVKRSNRGRKPKVVVEKEGYSIYNREATHLVGEFFTRKTDAINFLEKDQKMPWSQIKFKGRLVPVRVKISICEKDLKSLGVLK